MDTAAENPLTNLSEINADSVRLFDRTLKRHEDIRDIFLEKEAVTTAVEVEVPVGPDETETQLEYQNPTNEQVPALASLLDYLQQLYPPAPVYKYFNINRRHYSLRDGDQHLTKTTRVERIARHNAVMRDDYHVYLKRVTEEKRHTHVLIDVFSPTYYVRQVRNTRVVRPVVIFSEHL